MIPRGWTPWVLEPPEIQKYMVVRRIKLKLYTEASATNVNIPVKVEALFSFNL